MQELISQFTQRAEAVSATVRPMADLAEAFAYAARLCVDQGQPCLAAPGWEPGEQKALASACEQAGVELITQGLRAAVGRFYVGLTRAAWGVAETGTILVDSADEQVRLASMLAEAHVAVLPRSQVRQDMFALHDEVAALLAASPGYLASITGPSRTADIELVLTLGAHGPRQLHILFAGGRLMSRASRRAYHARLRAALDNPFLGATLQRFQKHYRASRKAGFQGLDFDALSAAVAQAKDAALPHLEELYTQFKARAEAAGARVHLAGDAEQAREIIADIARRAGVKGIVKSKSMTSEEIHLNAFLESQGFQVTETDLGEWIIQLSAGRGPATWWPRPFTSRGPRWPSCSPGSPARSRTPRTSPPWWRWPAGACAGPCSRRTWASAGPTSPLPPAAPLPR